MLRPVTRSTSDDRDRERSREAPATIIGGGLGRVMSAHFQKLADSKVAQPYTRLLTLAPDVKRYEVLVLGSF
jgi:hypothetical protein